MIVCITGMPGSGKSTAAKILDEEGFRIIEMGTFVRELMKEKGIRIDSDSLRIFSTALRKRHGPAAVAKLAAKAARTAKGDVAIIGIRSPSEVNSLRRALGSRALVVAITTPTKERYSRIEARQRGDDSSMRAGLEKRDRIEKGWGIDRAISMADIVVSNAGTRKELKRDIIDVVETLRSPARRKVRPAV